jgi:hypothetical protein
MSHLSVRVFRAELGLLAARRFLLLVESFEVEEGRGSLQYRYGGTPIGSGRRTSVTSQKYQKRNTGYRTKSTFSATVPSSSHSLDGMKVLQTVSSSMLHNVSTYSSTYLLSVLKVRLTR